MAPTQIGSPRIGIVGLGYVGLSTGLAFAAHGASVRGYDIRPETRRSVGRGSTPIRESGLSDLLQSQLRTRRFSVVNTLRKLVESSEGIFLCVPTPSMQSGRIDLRPLLACVRQLGTELRSVEGYRLVVVKSTVVPGTTAGPVSRILRHVSGRDDSQLGIACNPEFLAEASMVHDALRPTRVVLGTQDDRARAWLGRAYRGFDSSVYNLTPTEAELVKYSANAFLSAKISFANEISRLADRVGANVDTVMAAVGRDPRIGSGFLRAGPGFGGSCFDKDLRALIASASDRGITLRLPAAALQVNSEQLTYVLSRIRQSVGAITGKRFALLGLSFKPGTDDVRESRALVLARELVRSGARVNGHDPAAAENFERAWKAMKVRGGGRLQLFSRIEDALDGVDAAILQADWPVYSPWRSAWSRRMKRPLLIDLRRVVEDRNAQRTGLTLVNIGGGRAGSPLVDRRAGDPK
jgi:UDPglucose 6-dehydrogenase